MERATRARPGPRARLEDARAGRVASQARRAVFVLRARLVARPEVALIGRADAAGAAAPGAEAPGAAGDTREPRAAVCVGETLPLSRRGDHAPVGGLCRVAAGVRRGEARVLGGRGVQRLRGRGVLRRGGVDGGAGVVLGRRRVRRAPARGGEGEGYGHDQGESAHRGHLSGFSRARPWKRVGSKVSRSS